MFDLLADELVVLGIGGAILVAGCMPEDTDTSTLPKVLNLAAFILGCVMLAVALVEIVSR